MAINGPPVSGRFLAISVVFRLQRQRVTKSTDGTARPERRRQEGDEQALPTGEAGEIRVKGRHIENGYTDNPDETAIALRNGFVHTGDIGTLDEEGFLTIEDRKMNAIFVSGFNVFPREVQELLPSHPAVAGALGVGRAHERSGEMPVAFVTRRSAATGDEILGYCRENLIAYKQPEQVILLSEILLTRAGKEDRAALQSGLKSDD